MSVSPAMVWFRSDLRLRDNPALAAAVRRGGPVIPLYVWAPEEEGEWSPGAAARWWLHQSLRSLDSDLRACGSKLLIRRGPTDEALHQIACKSGAGAIFWNRRYEPALIERDSRLKKELPAAGLHTESFNASLLHEPWEVSNRTGRPVELFSAFRRS